MFSLEITKSEVRSLFDAVFAAIAYAVEDIVPMLWASTDRLDTFVDALQSKDPVKAISLPACSAVGRRDDFDNDIARCNDPDRIVLRADRLAPA